MSGSPSEPKQPLEPVKTHYEVLGLDASADAETIKKVFRREIAKYHPDKVIHLGLEFQELASVRAAELTIAYKTLTDQALRAEYDAKLQSGAASVEHQPDPPPHRQTPVDLSEYEAPREPAPAAPPAEEYVPPPPVDEPRPTGRRFASERAGRDAILRRAMAVRVQGLVENLYGQVRTPSVKGFDIALVPVAKPRFLGSPPPRVLVKVVDFADAATIAEAGANAVRARVHAAKSPVVVLLLATRIAPQAELSRALEQLERQRKSPDGPEELAVAILDVNDWSARLPPNVSTAVRKLVDGLRK